MAKKAKTFKTGDRVAYSAAWMKPTQSHERGRWRGTVETVEPFGHLQLVVIRWDHGPVASDYHTDGLGRVISPNLTLVDRIAVDAALAG